MLDCLRGLEKAISLGWYNFLSFDYKEYEHNHRLDNGDMNWIIPKKVTNNDKTLDFSVFFSHRFKARRPSSSYVLRKIQEVAHISNNPS